MKKSEEVSRQFHEAYGKEPQEPLAPDAHTHPEFTDFLRSLPEHSHEPIAQAQRSISALSSDLAAMAKNVAQHNHEHSHPEHERAVDHKGIASLAEEAIRVARSAEVSVSRHEHIHTHDEILSAVNRVWAEFARLENLIADVRREIPARALKDLEARMAQVEVADREHSHPLEPHFHKIGPHDHPELSQTPEQREQAQSVHEHAFDTWTAEGVWRCSICGQARDLPPTGVSEVSQ